MVQSKSNQGQDSRSASQSRSKGNSQKPGSGTSRKSTLKENKLDSGKMGSNG